MKEVVSKFIATFDCETGYSGAQRIMYIKGERAAEALRAVRDTWPNLAFYVRVSEEIPTSAIQEVNGGIILEVTQSEKKFVAASIYMDSDGVEETKETYDISSHIHPTVDPLESKPATREQVDEYLLSVPIDRKAKGPYDKAAADLNVTVDYVRGRYRKLREKGLVEKESVND